MANVAVAPDPSSDPAVSRLAARLSHALSLPLMPSVSAAALMTTGCDIALVVTPARLELRALRGPANLRGGRAVTCDWSKIDVSSSMGRRLNQPMLRAVGIRKGDPYRPRVLDATAGFGEDAWLLAAMGCRVTAVERSGVMAALLRDGLKRARIEHPDLAHRIEIIHADGIDFMRRGEGAAGMFDVVYLDPMFPTGRKTMERKPMRVLRWLVGSDMDAGAMLEAALHTANRRVVVKRPLKGPPLSANQAQPSATHKARGVRYDVYAGVSLG